ncbi:MAG: glucosamine-6-phosphate deaminase [Oscillospiraceae bacterium]|nr:glucosamine-6-phosphate deaminase [Oscillospiraceae bacterium]
MNIIFCEDYGELSRRAAAIVASQIILKPNSVIGFATGATPIGLYEELVSSYKKGEISFADIRAFNLDEYLGVSRQTPTSFYAFMQDNLFAHVDVKSENTDIPDGQAADIDAECARYTEALDMVSGGIDLQILGIGANGHIGFNEPDDHFELDTHVVELAESSIEGQKPFFDDHGKIPTKGVTMGIRAIIAAKQILLLASGEGKAGILREALFGPVKPQVPASILQLHDCVSVVADRAALGKILEKYPECVL